MRYHSVLTSPDFATLNEGQKITALAAMQGKNILISGGGGVGKSHLIRFIVQHLTDLILTASTGIAAINIMGQTLDSLISPLKRHWMPVKWMMQPLNVLRW